MIKDIEKIKLRERNRVVKLMYEAIDFAYTINPAADPARTYVSKWDLLIAMKKIKEGVKHL